MISRTHDRPRRSRHGCMTCKIRRVKCDETKPTCHRCRSTGRRCDGYIEEPAPNTQDMKVIQYTPHVSSRMQGWVPPSLHESLTAQERVSWEFFHFQTASCFGRKAGHFLLSAAHTDPIIRTAALAVGSLHRVFLYENNGGFLALSTGRQAALRQYNLAVRRGLNLFSQSSRASTDSILVMCALFFCFECLQGHYQAALQHVASGIRILRHQERESQTTGGQFYRPYGAVQHIMALMENQMLEVDGRMSLPDTLNPPPRVAAPPPSIYLADMTTLEELGDAFKLFYNQFLHLLSGSQEQENHPPYKVQEYHAQVQDNLNHFSTALDGYITRHPFPSIDTNCRTYITTLRIWERMTRLILRVEWPPTETVWDQYTSEYKAILALAEEITTVTEEPGSLVSGISKDGQETISAPKKQPNHQISGHTYPSILPKPQSPSSPAAFSFSLGILPILWIVAISCRDSKTRYRAIDLMRCSKRQEGVWDSSLYTRVATRVARLEEEWAGLPAGCDYEPDAIPMAARVSTVVGQFGEGRKGNVRYIWDNQQVVEESLVW